MDLLQQTTQDKRLGAGIIDGRSIWKDDGTAATILGSIRASLGADQPISVQVAIVDDSAHDDCMHDIICYDYSLLLWLP